MGHYAGNDLCSARPAESSISSPVLQCAEAGGCNVGEESCSTRPPLERIFKYHRSRKSHAEETHASSALPYHCKQCPSSDLSCTAHQAEESGARIRSITSFSSSSDDLLSLPTISPHSSRSDLSAYLQQMASSSSAHRPSRGLVLFYQLRRTFDRCSESQSFWLGLYFALNLMLTLYNKVVLVSFPFPYTLTTIHAFCGSVGGRYMLQNGFYQPKRLNNNDYITLLAFSILYSVNIAISNVSLKLVTVPVRA